MTEALEVLARTFKQFKDRMIYPDGGPVYWKNERSGIMAPVVMAFLEGHASSEQVEVVRAYCEYWIWAPGFVVSSALKEHIARVKTAEELCVWLAHALDEGIDPL